jgi:hypothetical protein
MVYRSKRDALEGMMTQPPIIYDFGAIGRRLRELESKTRPLALPPGVVILLDTDIRSSKPSFRAGDVVFVLHLGDRAVITLAHMRASEHARRVLQSMVECLKPEYPSLEWAGMELYLTIDDGTRLARQVSTQT